VADAEDLDLDEECLGRALNVVARQARRLLEHRLAEHGASFAGYLALRELARHGPLGNAELATRLGVEAPTVTRQVNRLVAEGLLTRTTPEADRRSVTLTLTATGRTRLRTLHRAVQDADRALTQDLTPTDLTTFHTGLHTLATRLEQLPPASA